MKGPLDPYRRSRYSQHGEDGILEFLTGRLGMETGHCCEFGAGDGTDCSNTLALLEQGWHGLYIEPDLGHQPALEALAARLNTLTVRRAIVLPTPIDFGLDDVSEITTLEAALLDAAFPMDLDVLSIDTEGMDYAIWDSFKFRPRIVIIEINSMHIGTMIGTALLGQRKNYTCVAHCGNLVFVRGEDFERLGIPRAAFEPPEKLYTPDSNDW